MIGPRLPCGACFTTREHRRHARASAVGQRSVDAGALTLRAFVGRERRKRASARRPASAAAAPKSTLDVIAEILSGKRMFT